MDELIFFLQLVRLKLRHVPGNPIEKGHEITRQKSFLPQAISCGVCHRMAFCKCTSAVGNGSMKKLHRDGCSMSLGGFTQGVRMCFLFSGFMDTHLVGGKICCIV